VQSADVTVTDTTTATDVATATETQTATSTDLVTETVVTTLGETSTAVVFGRALTDVRPPAYATACSSPGQYASACSCIGVVPYTVTAATPSTTVAVTIRPTETATHSATATATTTSTQVFSTLLTVVASATTRATTTTTRVVATATQTALLCDTLGAVGFELWDHLLFSKSAGECRQQCRVDPQCKCTIQLSPVICYGLDVTCSQLYLKTGPLNNVPFNSRDCPL